MYNMLKMKKMNGLKIFALVLLNLSKFETMFGMEENENEDEINDEYVNKNCYLIDDLGNKITLNDCKDIKFKIYNKDLHKKQKICVYTIEEEGKTKTLVAYEKEKNISYPIPFVEDTMLVSKTQNGITMKIIQYNDPKKYPTDTIQCNLIEKIGEDSIKDDYILVDVENKKIEKINGKNILFKLLTRKKCLELNKKLKDPNNYLKNDDEKYIIDDAKRPLFFEKVDNDLILYVRRSENNLWLANFISFATNINFNKDNSIEVRMAKKGEIDKVEEEGEKAKKEEIPMVKKEEEVDSSKCCCGIC